MAIDYCVDVCKELGRKFQAAELHRPMRIARFDPGDELAYEITDATGAKSVAVNTGQKL